MNLKPIVTAVLIASAAIITAGCATGGHDRTGREAVSDASLTTKVKSALLAEKDVNSFDISVETYNGTVQLAGFVDSQWQIDKAVEVASGVNGVQHVKNDLVHKSR